MKRVIVISAALALLVGVVFLAVNMGGGSTVRGQEEPTPTPTPTPTPLPAECDIGVVAPGIVASTNSLVMKVGDPPAVVDLTATFKNNGAVTQGVPDETCSFARVYAAEIGTGDILTDTPVDPTKLGVRVEPYGATTPPYGDVCIECSPANKALGWTAAQCLQGHGMGDYYPTPPPPWDYYLMPCDEQTWPAALPFSMTAHSCEDGLDNLGSEAGTCDWGGFSKQCVTPTTADATCLDVPLIGLIPLFRAVLAPDATDTTAREVKIECREPGTYSLVLAAGVGKASTSTSAPYLGPNQDPNQANDITATVITVTCTDATPTPTPTPLPAECDIGVVAPGIVASVAGTPIAALTMMVSDPPAVVDLTATFNNNGAVTEGAPDVTCSFARVYAAEIGTGDILTDTPVDPTKLGVRVEPFGLATPPYGDVCIECSAANKALGWTAAECTLQGHGMGDYYPTPPPPWDYVLVPCDEGAFNPVIPLSFVNHSCEDTLDNSGSEGGTCDWGGFSKQCTTPTTPDATCLDVPLIGLIPLLRKVLAPDATDTTAREVKVECREPGTYPLVLAAGVGKASLNTSAPYLGPSPDPNAANDITATVITVTCTEPNTPEGSGVSVPLNGGTQTLAGIDLTFSEVSSGGSTSVTTTTAGPPPPTGFKIVGLSELPLYFDINTDASYSGELTVCIRYDESQVAGPESNLKLMHHLDEGFVDITTSVDTANDIICGTTTHLSIFVVAEPLATPTPTPTPTRPHGVGGTVKLPPAAIAAESGAAAEGSGWAVGAYAALAGLGAVIAIAAGGWFARRRWLR